MEFLAHNRAVYEHRAYFSDSALRCILPEHLNTVADAAAAIALAVGDLADRYGIYVREKSPQEDPGADELTGMQISFLDFSGVLCKPFNHT